MKRTLILIVALVMMLSLMAIPSVAHELPEHGHVLLLGADFEPNPEYDPDDPSTGPPYLVHGFDKCVEVANARPLGLHSHHHTLHQGRAGAALRSAGHFTVPLWPLTPFNGCADLEALR